MFEKGEIVSHTARIDKFYKVIEDLKNGQYEVEDIDPNIFGEYDRFIFIGTFLLSKSDRRNYAIDDILKK